MPPQDEQLAANDEISAFDEVGEQIRNAHYEVLFATMEWMKDEHMDSPGFSFAQAVTDLYYQVKAHPENYPRGMTVRVLLGNYPELATFTWGEQVWNVMDVLQKAGLPEMENPELGWKVELANFDGQNPHSHAKFLIIDGQKVMAAGFNYSYLHYDRNHPSGLGVSLVDFGLLMRGPVAQDALASFDDLWAGSNLVQCPDLNPPKGDWARHCTEAPNAAVADHIPEVPLYHPTTGNAVAFSLLRTSNRPESDRALDALIRSAQDRINIFEVNFSLEVYCSLGIIMDDFCSMQDALDYMQALLDVMEQNQVHIRVLTTDVNMNGIENSVAIETFQKELARRGLSHLAEFRYYTGRMHAKAFLVDDAFLTVGSQNFHYSAWGDDRGLVEYNLATDAPEAISEFQSAFDYYWQRSKPVVPHKVRTE
jgi:phosphatidylserine/phosphatidylglycerophosphate/cardiolipin synthase-like enzyme